MKIGRSIIEANKNRTELQAINGLLFKPRVLSNKSGFT